MVGWCPLPSARAIYGIRRRRYPQAVILDQRVRVPRVFLGSQLNNLIFACDSLVLRLGLGNDLAPYNVPREDIPKIAERALKSTEDPIFPKVVSLLESLYPK